MVYPCNIKYIATIALVLFCLFKQRNSSKPYYCLSPILVDLKHNCRYCLIYLEDALKTGCPSLDLLGYAIIRPETLAPNIILEHNKLLNSEAYTLKDYNWEGISASQQLHNNCLSHLDSTVKISREEDRQCNNYWWNY